MQHGVVRQPIRILIEAILLNKNLITYRDNALQVYYLYMLLMGLHELRLSRGGVGEKVSNCGITMVKVKKPLYRPGCGPEGG
jgi:hypothetical protein